MITVLFVTAAILLLAITFSVIATSERRSTASSVVTERAVQLADAGSERARRQIVAEFNMTYLSIANFLRAIRDDSLASLAGVHTVSVDGSDVHWQIIGVSDPNAAFGWIDVAATATAGSDSVQTVIRRVGFGASSTFDLAMLSETTDCMFCHLRVNGDVGNLVFMRPGWGEEGHSGIGSGGSTSGLGVSRINGNVFAAQDITLDQISGNRLNGAEVTGVIERFSRNTSLPVDLDGDGIADFPPIIREVAVENALGSISAANGSCVVALSGSYNPGACGSISQSGTINGNLVLIGTETNPIDIDGDVWVEGDVIISGYVRGLGGLYSGRNVYIAGDVQAVNAPYRVVSGQCVNETGQVRMTASEIAASGFSPEDACARRSIADNTDALRIAARGSVIIGDYTEYDAAGDLQGYADRQSAEFYRQQFGFTGSGAQRWYDRRNGDELRCSGTVCRNAEGQLVNSGDRVQLAGYDASFRPGEVTSGGSFRTWMSDAQYQEILGTEEFSHNTWRWEFGNIWSNGNSIADAVLGIIDSGFSLSAALEIVDRKVNFAGLGDGQWNNLRNRIQAAGHTMPARATLNLDNGNGNWAVSDIDGPARFHWSGNSLRVIHASTRSYETQVNRIDAFLYANQRIAGKTSMQAMSITGGLVARDLGILAPGRSLENGVFGNNYPDINNNRGTACSNPSSDYYVYGSEDCALTVNYDHRLRNGGYGYNIIEGRVGITLDWRLADSASDRVSP